MTTNTPCETSIYFQAVRNCAGQDPKLRNNGFATLARLAVGPEGAIQCAAKRHLETMFDGIGLTISHDDDAAIAKDLLNLDAGAA